jgi:hypothetical protein
MGEIVEHIEKEVGANPKSIATTICNLTTSLIFDCFHRELFKVCPKQKFTFNNECGMLKTYANACDDW